MLAQKYWWSIILFEGRSMKATLLFKQLGEIMTFESRAIRNMLHARVLSSQAAQLRALGKWQGLFQIFSLPAPTADTHTGAAVGTKNRKGSEKKWELPRQSPSLVSLG